jgi:biopolymer transport protein ExbD
MKSRKNYLRKESMKKINLIPIMTSVVLALVLVIMACGQTTPAATTTTPAPAATTTKAAAPTTTTVEVDKKYNCLSPQGIQLPVQISALAPRLDTFDGKVVYVNQGEADPIIMPALWTRVQKDKPNTTWKLIASNQFGSNAPEQEVIQTAKAVIRGISW